MRRILFSILLAGAANIAIAQKFSIGVNGGVSVFSRVANLDPGTEIWEGKTDGTISPMLTLKGTFTAGNWQFGLSVDYTRANYRTQSIMGFESYVPIGNDLGPFPAANVKVNNASLMPLRFLGNRQVSLKKFTVYGGVNASYVILPERRGIYISDDAMNTKNGDYGFGAGVQCGMLYPVSKHISINAEAAASKMWIRQGPLCLFSMYNTITSLGLIYRLK